MKAIRVNQFGGPDVLRLEEVPDPRPGSGQVLVRLQAIGINPVETYVRSGQYARLPVLPYTPGTDAAGWVESVGTDVVGWKTGDRVYTSRTVSGAYAEKALCLAADIHRLPELVSFSQGAALGIPYATAYRALFKRGRAQAGEVVLVHGASGGVGIAAVQLARAAGLIVWGSAGTEAGLKLILEQGAHLAFDHRRSDYLHQIRTATNVHPINLILEMLANVNLSQDLSLLGKRGRIVIIGSRGPIEINPREAMSRDADILGMTLFNAGESELASIHAALAAGLENRTLRPVIGGELPLADAASAHERILKPGALGKLVLLL